MEEALAAVDRGDMAAAVGAWEDAWLAAGTLKARLDGRRVAAVSLLEALPPDEAERAHELEGELAAVTVSHAARWRSVTGVIAEAGRRLAPRERHEVAQPRPAPVPSAPEPTPIPVAVTAIEVAVAPGPSFVEATPAPLPAGSAEPPTAGIGARRRVSRIAVLVIVGLAVVGGTLAGAIGSLFSDQGTVSDLDRQVSAGADSQPDATAASRTASASASASPSAPWRSTAGSAVALPLLVTVDLHPVGPLRPDELPITRIIGTPEVVPFPTSFDRSLRLIGALAGVCFELAAPTTDRASSMAFDLHLGESGSDGKLGFVLVPSDEPQAIGVALDLLTAPELDRDAWYRVVVTSRADAGRIEMTPLGDGQPVLEADLVADPTILVTSSDEACLQSTLSSAEAFLHVDNLRIER